MRTLLVTNDFPPRPGGIQSFIHNLAIRQPADSLVVYTSRWPGAEEFDATLPFPVVREATSVLLPKRSVSARAVQLAREHGCTTALFGAAAPLGLLASRLRREAGIQRTVALTHGHEVGWAAVPGGRSALRRICRDLDVLTYLGEYTRVRLERALRSLTEFQQLSPGVDIGMFHPDVDGMEVRRRHQLADRPVVVCISRLVPRKGQDALIRALPLLQRRVPEAALLMVGGGPDRGRLLRLARRCGVAADVVFSGTVPAEQLPCYYAAGDVYAMPCRTRLAGLEVEGLGIVYLEASASGLPVVAGDSGGAPDAVREGETGFVVDGTDRFAIADRLARLLTDRRLAAGMGGAGRAWMESEWGWDRQAERLRTLLAGSQVT